MIIYVLFACAALNGRPHLPCMSVQPAQYFQTAEACRAVRDSYNRAIRDARAVGSMMACVRRKVQPFQIIQ